MARVVSRRTPPYLLIVFVILFVFATVMAVLFFHKLDQEREQSAKNQSLLRRLISRAELDQPEIKRMQKNFDSARGTNVQKTVVGQLSERNSVLAQRITGSALAKFDQAESEIDKTFDRIEMTLKEGETLGRHGLLQYMTDFNDRLAVKDTEIVKLENEKKDLRKQIDMLNQTIAQAQQTFKGELDDKVAEIAALDQKFRKFEDDHNKQLGSTKQEYEASVGDVRKEISALTTQTETLALDVKRWKKKYEIERDKRRDVAIDIDSLYRRPDGKIIKVLGDAGLIYVNIGSNDNVSEDLTLSVYPYTGIPTGGDGKAVIQIADVGDDVSACRIIYEDKANPIIPGDLVANVVYDRLRTYSFVVEGQFDLSGAGQPTMAGNNAIKEFVRQYGGRVVKEIGGAADFVILGDAPGRPEKPADTDPQGVWDLYNERMKAFGRYEEVVKLADLAQIPRIDGQRFLDLIGYVPTKLAKNP